MLNIHKIIYNSNIYGPGSRTVIWFKGCSIRCEGCINTELWSFEIEQTFTVEQLVNKIQGNEVSLIGGEPLDQNDIEEFIMHLKKNDIGIVLFTGYSLNDIQKFEIAKLCDIVVSEPFKLKEINSGLYLRGSNNQLITFFSNRYNNFTFKEIENYELIINDQIEIRGRDKDFIDKILK